MKEVVQCLNCGKFYPDFVSRQPIYKNWRGKTATPSAQGAAVLMGVLILAGLVAFIARVASLLALLAWGFGALVVLVFLYGVYIASRPRVGYAYRCKSCGHAWQVRDGHSMGTTSP